jgi:Nuclease-related domain
MISNLARHREPLRPGDKWPTGGYYAFRPLVSYAEHVEQVTWRKRKSHRSSAPPAAQGRDGAHPPHAPAAATPGADPAAATPGADPAAADISLPTHGPLGAGPQAATPRPAPAPADTSLPSHGPLGAGPFPESDRPIWDPGPADEGYDEPRRAGGQAAPPGPADSGPDGTAREGATPVLVPGQAAGPDGPALQQHPGPRERIARRLRLGDLAADSRMRIWKRRAGIAIVAGCVFTFIFTWRAGLTAAVLAGIADAIYRSRTTASMPPGVRLTGAQKRTQRQLAHMERAGYRALHSRPIPGSREFIDHFVVGPTGVYAIDSESWDKRLPVRTKNARQLWHGPFSKKDRLEHARWEAKQASDRLAAELGTEVYVRPAMAVYGPQIPWTVATIRDVDVFSGSRLRKYLRRSAGMKDRPKLGPAEIERVYAAAARVLPLTGASYRTPVA